ncbi:glycosyltransferase [Polaribacter sp.]|uniref:glycosyltransferase n=1 Tax=Polaribacter sp. TaxID=1920175 RepID=UPI003EF581F8
MNLLFFDIQITGHHIEYINHILKYLSTNNNSQNNYYFVVHQNFLSTNTEGVKLVSAFKNIIFIEVSTLQIESIEVGNKVKKSINNTKLVKSYVDQLNIDVCYLMFFNNFQIGLGFVKMACRVKGILFMQFTNMKISSLKSYYYYLRRLYPLLLAMHNKSIDSIFLLNDKQSALMLNNKFKKKDVFKYLVDPIPIIKPIKNFSLKDQYDIAANKSVFLHFGSLSDRKGVIEIIAATYLLEERIQKKTTILIVGKTSDKILEKQILEDIELANKKTFTQLIWDNSFVANSKMASLFLKSNYILMPYKNPEASSGILGHAMYANKPVIGPSLGLIGRIIKENKMGVCLASIDPKNIADAMSKIETIEYNSRSTDTFLQEHTPKNFAHTLLS